ncbi:MAG: hypothetical protein LBP79_00445 [Clostridiales bacterium]|jgi:hypothetical protein|nr:hypothetical protein [Clostridiales bacterium]
MTRSEELKKVIALCDYIVSAADTSPEWTADFALFGFALSRLDGYIGEDRYYMFLKSFCDVYARSEPFVNSLADAAPVITVAEMYARTGCKEYAALASYVINLCKKLPDADAARLSASGLHPLRTERVMLFVLAEYLWQKNGAGGIENGGGIDANYGAGGGRRGADAITENSKNYAAVLMNKKDNLFHRSYFKAAGLRFPLGRNYRARDNVIALFVLSLIAEGEDYVLKDINELILKLTTAVNNYRNIDGSYNPFFRNGRKSLSVGFLTDGRGNGGGAPGGKGGKIAVSNADGSIVADPFTAAYYAASCMKNASAGIIDSGYAETGKKAYLNAVNGLVTDGGAIYMPETRKKGLSGMLKEFFNGIGGGAANKFSGAAGLIFAAIEYEKLRTARINE